MAVFSLLSFRADGDISVVYYDEKPISGKSEFITNEKDAFIAEF